MVNRTFEEVKDEATGEVVRWNLLQDDKYIEGAYIEKVDEEAFGLHFPRLEYRTVPTLSIAKAIFIDAPLLKRRCIAIGHQSSETQRDAFVTLSEAAELLELSRARVGAMVANGVLSAKEFDGEALVSRKSIERKLGTQDINGPSGKFANQFVQYFPDSSVNEFYLAEVDAMNANALEAAKGFVNDVQGNEKHPGGARLVSYKSAMRLRSSRHVIATDGAQSGVISFAHLLDIA